MTEESGKRTFGMWVVITFCFGAMFMNGCALFISSKGFGRMGSGSGGALLPTDYIFRLTTILLLFIGFLLVYNFVNYSWIAFLLLTVVVMADYVRTAFVTQVVRDTDIRAIFAAPLIPAIVCFYVWRLARRGVLDIE